MASTRRNSHAFLLDMRLVGFIRKAPTQGSAGVSGRKYGGSHHIRLTSCDFDFISRLLDF